MIRNHDVQINWQTVTKTSRRERVHIHFHVSVEIAAHLDRMAEEAGVTRAALARSMIESILEDDAKAHAEAFPKLNGEHDGVSG